MRRSWLAGLMLGLLPLSGPAVSAAGSPQLVIYDNDFSGAACDDILPLLADPTVTVLGFTMVSGDSWRDEGAATLLRALEIYHRGEIPVYLGAVFPLVNRPARMRAWEGLYGKIPWKGAWNDAAPGQPWHPDDPALIPPLDEGSPQLKPAAGRAVDFMIEAVHAHPHEVTIIAAGPLTNIALAIAQDPDFAGLAKQLIFMGGLLGTNLGQVTGDADFNSDFNIVFDPEAAHITLTAPWAMITSVGNVSNDVLMTPDITRRLLAKTTPASGQLAKHPWTLPMWDQLTTAIAVDPAIITRQVSAYMDVEIDHGLHYGTTHVWPATLAPHLGEQKVTIVLAVDQPRFFRDYIAAAQSESAYSR